MSFVNVGDIAACAKFAYKVYEIGFSKVKNACKTQSFLNEVLFPCLSHHDLTDLYNVAVQYDEFGQDVYRLHENLKEVGKVFSSVKANARGPIPQDSEFYDTRSLNSILDKPFRTIKECETLLDNRTAFSKDSGFIQNIYCMSSGRNPLLLSKSFWASRSRCRSKGPNRFPITPAEWKI